VRPPPDHLARRDHADASRNLMYQGRKPSAARRKQCFTRHPPEKSP
jgi:hypothetical protein